MGLYYAWVRRKKMNAIVVEGTHGNNHLEDLDIKGRMVLVWFLNKVRKCGVYAPGIAHQ